MGNVLARGSLQATGHTDLVELAFYARPLAPALNLTLRLHEDILGTDGTVSLPLPPAVALKQRAFTLHATKKLIQDWDQHPNTTPQLAAWRQSCGGPHGGAWLQFPSQPTHFMPDDIFDLSVRVRLCDDILKPGPCPLQGANGNRCPGHCDAKGHHALGCTFGAGAVKRHDAVVNTLHKIIHNWGHLPVHREQMVPTDHDEYKRADIVFTDSENRRRPIDVMVVGPSSTQALAMGSARKRGTAANSGETLKLRQYGLQRVTPAVLEAAGYPGPSLRQLIKSLVPPDDDRSTTIQSAFQSIACAMHSQQSRTVLNLLRRDGTRPDVVMLDQAPAGVTALLAAPPVPPPSGPGLRQTDPMATPGPTAGPDHLRPGRVGPTTRSPPRTPGAGSHNDGQTLPPATRAGTPAHPPAGLPQTLGYSPPTAGRRCSASPPGAKRPPPPVPPEIAAARNQLAAPPGPPTEARIPGSLPPAPVNPTYATPSPFVADGCRSGGNLQADTAPDGRTRPLPPDGPTIGPALPVRGPAHQIAATERDTMSTVIQTPTQPDDLDM